MVKTVCLKISEKKEREELSTYFKKNPIHNPLALTLTLKQRIESSNFRGRFGSTLDQTKTSQNTRHFLNRLNQQVYGKGYLRFGKRLSAIPVIEGNDFIRLHVHMTLEHPNHIELTKFKRLISECWSKTNFGYNDIVIKPVHDYSGWINYTLKSKSKNEGLLSSVDWNNVYLH